MSVERRCEVCAQLSGHERASQKHGWDEESSHLPTAASRLLLVKDLRPGGSRELKLLRCPLCATHYLYRTDYEYLANGSEDEQELIRLRPQRAEGYLRPA